MVHRDIKPKNLMIETRADEFEKLLLTDFGITQKLRHHTLLLSRIQVEDKNRTLGTLPYISWEQIRGAPASANDDIYLIGATIFELLTGRPPFYEGILEKIRHQIEITVPPTMTERLRQFDLLHDPIPEVWEDTVAACLAKRPIDRPQSVREIMARLGLSASEVLSPQGASAAASWIRRSDLQRNSRWNSINSAPGTRMRSARLPQARSAGTKLNAPSQPSNCRCRMRSKSGRSLKEGS